MSAYMIVTAIIHDRAAFMSGYGPAAGALVEQFGGSYCLRAPGAVTLEGATPDGASIVISRWPSKDAALAFWNSPEYGDIRTTRYGIADCQVLLIEGEMAG